MNQIDKDFVYNRYPKTEHDIQLLETYKQDFLAENVSYDSLRPLSEMLRYFPVYEGTVGAEKDYPILTRYGFMALSIDPEFMDKIFRPNCRALINAKLSADVFNGKELRLLRSSLIEFALLGCMEAQQLMSKLDCLFGEDDGYIESIVNNRCSNLKRFLNAHEGAGRGVNEGDVVSSYEQALKEVKAGGKVTGYQLSDGRTVSKEEGVAMAKAGEIRGVGVAHRKDTEYLKSLPDGTESNNLSSLPTVH